MKRLLDAAPNIVEVVMSFSLSLFLPSLSSFSHLEAQMPLWACNICDSQPKVL